jgi:hypothetical protein
MDNPASSESHSADLWPIHDLVLALGERYEHLAGADADAARASLDELIELLDQALADADADAAHSAWPVLMSMAIEGHGERWLLTGATADREAMIGLLDRYLAWLTGPGHSVLPNPPPPMPAAEAYRQRAWLLGDRYTDPGLAGGDRADLDLAVAQARAAVQFGPEADIPAEEEGDFTASLHFALGRLLAIRYENRDGQPGGRRWSDGETAITELRLAREGLSDPEEPEVCWFLGHLLADRYSGDWPGAASDPADRDDALRLLAVVAESEESDQLTLITLVDLAISRVADTSDRAHREELIKWAERLLADPELEPPLAADAHGTLGLALSDRAEYADDPRAVRGEAIAHLEAELELRPADDPDRWMQLGALAEIHWDYVGGDDSEWAAMDRMADVAMRAWALAPPDERELLGLYLATGLYERYRRPAEVTDLDGVVLAMEGLADVERRIDDPDLGRMVLVLMMTFKTIYAQLTGSAESMREAEPWIMRAIDEVPADDPQWAFTASNLGMSIALLAADSFTSEMTDKAIGVLLAVSRTPGVEPPTIAQLQGLLGLMLVQRAGAMHGRSDLDEGIAHLRASWQAAQQDDAERVSIAVNLGTALLLRYAQRGDRQDLDAARWYAAAIGELARKRPGVREATPNFDVIVGALGAQVKAFTGHADGDLNLMDAAITELRLAHAQCVPGSQLQSRLRNDLGFALQLRTALAPAGAQELQEMLELLTAGADLPKGNLMRPLAVSRLAGALVGIGAAAADPVPVTAAIKLLTDLLDELGPDHLDRIRFSAQLGVVYRYRYDLTGDPADIKLAIGSYERSRDALGRVPGHPVRCLILIGLARCYRVSGDLAAARQTGLTALRERGQDVLLQTGTTRGLGYAGLAARESAEVAGWCLADGELDAAVAALELGRSLVLHVATVVTSVADLLDDAGQAELAARWRASPAANPHDEREQQPWDVASPDGDVELLASLDDAAGRIPDDLRVRVLEALGSLAADSASRRLTGSPAVTDIAAAIAETGADALVYLLEPVGEGPGYAVILPADAAGTGELDCLELPLLARSMSGSLDGYIAAQAGWASEQDDSVERWRQALEQLCDWAWLTVMGPLLGRFARLVPGRVPRLVLVPVGRLSVVPWQAARSTGEPGRSRFALADAVLSYAASGRLLIDVSRRPALDLQASPVVVADPARRLPFAVIEAESLMTGCYPSGRYLGRVAHGRRRQAGGRGTSAELLAELPTAHRPGASMLHLGCHVYLDGAAPLASYLDVADGERLTIETILKQAGGRPAQAPGGLVSLAACASGYGVAAYDEALSLATAFLAGGAVTVTSTRWPIDDDRSAPMTFMFHYFMTTRGESPRDALRLAQLWMIDPDRSAPAEMPPELAKDVPYLGSVPISEWAAFTHQGR